MLSLTAAGTIGRDAETKDTQSGSVTSFSLATDVRVGREKSTQWIDVSMWGKRGESLRSYLTKGSKVTVVGSMNLHEHNGKTYLKLNANEIGLQGGKRDEGGSQGGGYDQSHQAGSGGSNADLEDEVPF